MAYKTQYDFWIEDLYIITVIFHVITFMEMIFGFVYTWFYIPF